MTLDWAASRCGSSRSAAGASASPRMGLAIGALTREVRAASLLALHAVAAAGLPGAGARGLGGPGLYDVIRAIYAAFPFKAALDALDAR